MLKKKSVCLQNKKKGARLWSSIDIWQFLFNGRSGHGRFNDPQNGSWESENLNAGIFSYLNPEWTQNNNKNQSWQSNLTEDNPVRVDHTITRAVHMITNNLLWCIVWFNTTKMYLMPNTKILWNRMWWWRRPSWISDLRIYSIIQWMSIMWTQSKQTVLKEVLHFPLFHDKSLKNSAFLRWPSWI